jgi:hypothetical protein
MSDGDLPGADDVGQDPCSFFASFINQRQQVERLLNWLRESQTACTDTNCFDDINGLSGSEHGNPLANDHGNDHSESILDEGPIAVVLCVVFALMALYAVGLNANRRNEDATLPAKSGLPAGDRDRHDDDHGPFRRRNNDDDHTRPAI